MEGVFRQIQRRFQRNGYSQATERKINIALVGPRNLDRAHVLSSFLKDTPEGQRIYKQLKSAGRAKLFTYLVTPDRCPLLTEQAMDECSHVIVSSEDKELYLKFSAKFLAEKRQCQICVVPSLDLEEGPEEEFPVHDGIKFYLNQYCRNILITTVSPDLSMAKYFLKNIVL